MANETTPTETVTRKPDDDVGTPGTSPAAGGHQSAQQAEITNMNAPGKTDEDRKQEMRDTPSIKKPTAIGGSSGGHADQKAADGDEKIAAGQYKVE